MFDLRFKALIYLFLFLAVSSCMISTKQEKEIDPPITYKGWWVYGEGQHIFKDEATLGEWQLSFPNENFEELVELYLAVCEMEYFPMECEMHGNLINDTLIVKDFEILYIQGCGE
tara:strand:- start:189 stop:533 length:345 start_codon:yes stop_codon:yes gene_type:complete